MDLTNPQASSKFKSVCPALWVMNYFHYTTTSPQTRRLMSVENSIAISMANVLKSQIHQFRHWQVITVTTSSQRQTIVIPFEFHWQEGRSTWTAPFQELLFYAFDFLEMFPRLIETASSPESTDTFNPYLYNLNSLSCFCVHIRIVFSKIQNAVINNKIQ